MNQTINEYMANCESDPDHADHLSKPRILVIDDEQSICDLVRVYLSKQGYAVATCNSGLEGEEYVRSHEVDLVILDLVLPDYDGLEVLKNLREINPEVPVIIVTGLDLNNQLRERIVKAGTGALIRKTKPLKELLDNVIQLLGRRGNRIFRHLQMSTQGLQC